MHSFIKKYSHSTHPYKCVKIHTLPSAQFLEKDVQAYSNIQAYSSVLIFIQIYV